MKVKLNTLTNYEGCTFKLGDEIDIPLNVAERWINKGLAHPAKEEIKPVIVKAKEEVTEVDVIEPIPMDHYVDFDEPIEVKVIKKAKKNK